MMQLVLAYLLLQTLPINDSHNVVYPDGANIDILTLERIGDGTPD